MLLRRVIRRFFKEGAVEIAVRTDIFSATNVNDSGGSLGEELGEELGEIFYAFSCCICCAE